MTNKYKSEALAAAHEAALGLAEAGLLSGNTLQEFDKMCLAPVEDTNDDAGINADTEMPAEPGAQ